MAQVVLPADLAFIEIRIEFEMKLSTALQVLVIDDNQDLRLLVCEQIQKKFSIIAEQTDSLSDAWRAIDEEHFDIVFFGHSNWQGGLQIYADIVNKNKSCQFIMFMNDPNDLGSNPYRHLKIVRKPDFDKLIDMADWPNIDPSKD